MKKLFPSWVQSGHDLRRYLIDASDSAWHCDTGGKSHNDLHWQFPHQLRHTWQWCEMLRDVLTIYEILVPCPPKDGDVLFGYKIDWNDGDLPIMLDFPADT